MNIEHFKKQLLKLEKELAARTEGHLERGREQTKDDSVQDQGDASVAEQVASQEFTEAELDSNVLQQVRDALQRIDNHSYGKCIVDGEPIEPKRLKAMPWTPYCLKHQEALEAKAGRQYPTM